MCDELTGMVAKLFWYIICTLNGVFIMCVLKLWVNSNSIFSQHVKNIPPSEQFMKYYRISMINFNDIKTFYESFRYTN